MLRGALAATWLFCLGGGAMAAWIIPGCNDLGESVGDGGTAEETGAYDSTTGSSSGTSGSSSGVTSSSSSGSGGSSGSSGSGSGSGGSSVCEGGVSCTAPAANVPVNLIPGYVPVHPMPSACSISQIVQYDVDCTNPFSQLCVQSFFEDAGSGSCGACANPGTFTDAGVFVPSNMGATMYDGTGGQWPNLPGCVALFDKNTGCSSVLWNFLECAYAACACCASMGGDMPGCIAVTETGACKAPYAAVTAACQADYAPGGSLDTPNCNGASGIGERGAVASAICAGGPPVEAGVDANDGGVDGAADDGGDEAGD